MKKILLLTLTVMSTTVFANELQILSWYRLNPDVRDRAAEVCFSLKPAPTEPTFAQITVDQGFQSQAFYSTWISNKGSVCHVVSTIAGRVNVEVPTLKINSDLTFQ